MGSLTGARNASRTENFRLEFLTMHIDAQIQTADLNAPLFATGTAKNMPDVNLSPADQ